MNTYYNGILAVFKNPFSLECLWEALAPPSDDEIIY